MFFECYHFQAGATGATGSTGVTGAAGVAGAAGAAGATGAAGVTEGVDFFDFHAYVYAQILHLSLLDRAYVYAQILHLILLHACVYVSAYEVHVSVYLFHDHDDELISQIILN